MQRFDIPMLRNRLFIKQKNAAGFGKFSATFGDINGYAYIRTLEHTNRFVCLKPETI